MACHPERVPEDILPPIFEQLTDRRDLHACSLVSWTFNRAVTPVLYRSWDVKVIVDLPAGASYKTLHPVKTLLARRDLLQYVRHARGTGTIHKYGSELYEEYLTTLRLCTHLQTFSWTYDHADRITGQRHSDPASHDVADKSLRDIIQVLRTLPIKELTIRTYSGLSEDAWSEMRNLTGLEKLSLWCMEGQPRVLQGWSEILGGTLKHLELGRTQGVPATILLSVLSQLPLLQSLALKGAPSSSIVDILTFLPNLTSLDVDYISSRANVRPSGESPMARLKYLTVRTNDLSAAHRIWVWIKQLVPYPSLESFKLLAFSVHEDAYIPTRFILDLARVHKEVLKHFHVNGASMALQDVQCLCSMFPNIEELSWPLMFINDITEIRDVVACARKLRVLQVDADWAAAVLASSKRAKFGIDDARHMMLRDGSQLRNVCICGVAFKGKWVPRLKADGTTIVEFEIVQDEIQDM